MEYTGKHIVCVDAGAASRVALRFACKKTSKRGGVVEMLHVCPPPDMQNMFGALEKVREEQRADAQKLMDELCKSAQEYSGITPQYSIREGSLGEEILAAAVEDQNLDMLILGVSQVSSEGRKLINWISGALGDKLFVPVLLVPGNLTDMQIDALS